MEPKLPRNLAIILVYLLLFSPDGIKPLARSNSHHKQSILRHEIRLKAELVKIKIKLKIKNNEDLMMSEIRDSVVLPRYIRVNTLKTSVDNVIRHFEAEGYKLEEPTSDWSNLGPKTIRKDRHLPDLLILPSNTDLHDHALYLSGEIIIQDKASCFPAYICSPPLNAHVIDACAAPGNKTSHLSVVMQNTGKIWAFDLDKNRLNLLKMLTQKAGCKNIEPIHGSFLDVNPLDQQYSSVKYLLLDPSCSGSGIVNRLDRLIDTSIDQEDSSQRLEERLEKLSEFQEKIILHAFKFPSAKKIVYSTCSIHAEENEHVVQRALDQTDIFELADKNEMIPTWPRRGDWRELRDKATAEKLIRANPNEDRTNGFFVACFMRKIIQPIDQGINCRDNDTFIEPYKKRKGYQDYDQVKKRVKDSDEWVVKFHHHQKQPTTKTEKRIMQHPAWCPKYGIPARLRQLCNNSM